MDKVQFFKHTINYHVAQIDLEAYATEEFCDWIDQYPPHLHPYLLGILSLDFSRLFLCS